eukprot:GEMP01028053.1.p1 GENE.GEMP01028053.1~~GEMP01028053.1.p1  ORF type:complete len:255 (+),score=53.17 GEMP01028053.1:108-872(+)
MGAATSTSIERRDDAIANIYAERPLTRALLSEHQTDHLLSEIDDLLQEGQTTPRADGDSAPHASGKSSRWHACRSKDCEEHVLTKRCLTKSPRMCQRHDTPPLCGQCFKALVGRAMAKLGKENEDDKSAILETSREVAKGLDILRRCKECESQMILSLRMGLLHCIQASKLLAASSKDHNATGPKSSNVESSQNKDLAASSNDQVEGEAEDKATGPKSSKVKGNNSKGSVLRKRAAPRGGKTTTKTIKTPKSVR